jgi:hypothetical protein
MKKLLLLPILFILSLSAHAQLFVGPSIGMNTSNLRYSNSGATYKNQWSTNFRVGAIVAYNGDHKVIYHTGLFYYGKGANVFSSAQQNDAHIVIHSIQLPVYANIQSKPGRYGRFYLGGGGFVDYQFAAKSYHGTSGGTKIDFGSDIGDLKHFDAGLCFQFGYRVNDGFGFGLQYQLGLANLSGYDGQNIKSMSFGITVAYMGRSGVTNTSPKPQ